MRHPRPRKIKEKYQIGLGLVLAAALVLALLLFMGFTTASTAESGGEEPSNPEERWGVHISAPLRLTGKDYFLDFRYRVVDPEKAAPLLKRGEEAYLLDQATGAKLPVPVTKVGPLRATTVEPKAGRQYSILFANVGNIVKRGSKVTVVIGEFRAENLTVE